MRLKSEQRLENAVRSEYLFIEVLISSIRLHLSFVCASSVDDDLRNDDLENQVVCTRYWTGKDLGSLSTWLFPQMEHNAIAVVLMCVVDIDEKSLDVL